MGHFISFEGIDGVGKSTQAKRLYRRLVDRDSPMNVELFREPGSTPAGEEIRRLLLNQYHDKDIDLAPMTQMLLFNAARLELIRGPLSRAQILGKWVLLDRYVDSTIAYQCYGDFISVDYARIIQDIVVGGVMPELTFILDMPPEAATMRLPVQEEKDRFESQALAYQNRVRDGYIRIAKQYPSRCVLINAELPEAAIADAIWNHIESRLL